MKAEALLQERLTATLAGFFGMVAYAVARRSREIGVRMSLGAGRETVVWMVLRSSLGMTLAGIALGLPLCLWLTRLASGLLFGVQPNDPSVLAGTAAVLVAVSALAAAIPARRSSRVDPVTALRSE